MITTLSLSILPTNTDDQQFMSYWLASVRSPSTKRAYKRIAASLLDCTGKELRMMTLPDVQDFLASEAEHLAPSSLAHTTGVIKSLFSFALETGYTQINVARFIRIPPYPDVLAKRILSESRVLRVIDLAERQRNHVLLWFLYHTGVRRSELCEVNWADLMERESGGQVTIYSQKTGGTRAILLSEELWQEIMALPEPHTGYLFKSQKKDHAGRLSESQVYRIVRAAGGLAGVERMSPHWMRHAHISHAQDRGCPLPLVMETSGHKSMNAVRRYSHARPNASSSQYLIR